jgi:hypothetical protein
MQLVSSLLNQKVDWILLNEKRLTWVRGKSHTFFSLYALIKSYRNEERSKMQVYKQKRQYTIITWFII